MEYECIESKRDGGWVVEAIDRDNEGAISRVLFMGANDAQLAREYAQWKNATAEPQRQSEQRRSGT